MRWHRNSSRMKDLNFCHLIFCTLHFRSCPPICRTIFRIKNWGTFLLQRLDCCRVRKGRGFQFACLIKAWSKGFPGLSEGFEWKFPESYWFHFGARVPVLAQLHLQLIDHLDFDFQRLLLLEPQLHLAVNLLLVAPHLLQVNKSLLEVVLDGFYYWILIILRIPIPINSTRFAQSCFRSYFWATSSPPD